MLSVTFICVGKMREKHYTDAFAEYEKRLSSFCRFELVEIAERKSADALATEAQEILAKIPRGAYTAALCVEGKERSSEELAEKISSLAVSGVSKLCFIVGGSNGLDGSVKKAADERLSMSRMTFPHHLARVMLIEQIYRAFTIDSGIKYHK